MQSRAGDEAGDRRQADRRAGDRRKGDRRAPTPLWRKPSSFVAYGAIGALLVVLLFRLPANSASEPLVATNGAGRLATPVPEGTVQSAPTGSVRDARSLAAFESLIAEGGSAVGEVVRAEVFCGSITAVTVREIEGMNEALQALADSDGRVAGARCQWTRDDRSSDFLLVVPPALAKDFASAPVVEINFVRRRQVPANLVWLGRSEALALRYAGVLQEVLR